MTPSLTYSECVTDSELEEIVRRLRRQGADDHLVEVKSAATKVPKDLWPSVSAFANTEGGLVILGLAEKDHFAPAEGFDATKILDEVRSGLDEAPGAHPKVQPLPDVDLERRHVDGADVVLLRIHPLREKPGVHLPCYVLAQGVTAGSYTRVGDADRHLTAYEMYLLSSRLQPDDTDRGTVPSLTADDLDEALVADLVSALRERSSRALDGIAPTDRTGALRRLNVLAEDHRLTLAGCLALAAYPQQDYPQLTIDVTVHPGAEKSLDGTTRFLDRRVCDGPLPVAVRDAVDTVLKNLRTRRVVDGLGGTDVPEIPAEVLREAIVNAVMHRDYSAAVRGQQVAVDVYPDRVEVINPGGFWGDRTKDNVAEGRSAKRNEVLAKLLGDARIPGSRSSLAETQGSGIPRMIHAMRQHGLPAPSYASSTIGHVIVRLDRFGLLDPEMETWLEGLPGDVDRRPEERSALALAKTTGHVTVADLRSNLGLDSDDCRDVLGRLLGDGLLIGINDGPYVLADLERTIVMTSAQHSVLAVLDAVVPRSVREIAELTGKSVSALRPVLRDLVAAGLIQATAPPQSKNRRYLLAP